MRVHPRPQLARADWTELHGEWEFAFDDADEGLLGGWGAGDHPFPLRIQVPFPFESPASGIQDTAVHPIVWYRRHFSLEPAADRRWLLHFGAVDYACQVWVNGSLVCAHQGGSTPFFADISSVLRGGEQVLVVRVEDRPDLEQPRGKQHWSGQPEEIWYDRTTGIWQPVWLEAVPDLRIEGLRWTPDVEHQLLGVDVTLSRDPVPGLELRVRLRRADQPILEDTYAVLSREVHRRLGVDVGAPSLARRRELLWSPEFPNLLDVDLSLLLHGEVVDEASSYVGLRDVDVRDGRFRLNGWPYYLRLVLDQGYWPQSHLAAPSADALREEVEMVKELGFNGVRMHQKVADPRFLYWCDRLGLLVWEEMPSAYRFSARAVEATATEWMAVLRRDYSHPCVVTWVAYNESWGVEHLRTEPQEMAAVDAMRSIAMSLDGTRPVIGNDGWEQSGSPIIGVHDYVASEAELAARYGAGAHVDHTLEVIQPNGHPIVLPGPRLEGAAIVLSEFGGVSLKATSGQPVFAYGSAADSTALLHYWETLFASVLESEILAGFCYTQFADTRQELNGVVTEDRQPKVDPALFRAIIQRPPRSIAAESILGQVLEPASVEVPLPDP